MAANPYSAPSARVADVPDETAYQPARLWSARGRIGRLRYLAYLCGMSLILGVLSGLATAALGEERGTLLNLTFNLPALVFCALSAIKRSHDANWSGWAAILAFIPVLNLILVFKSGTAGANDYGNPAPPNTTGIKILALLFPALVVVGLLAAIALPAYQDFVERAGVQQ